MVDPASKLRGFLGYKSAALFTPLSPEECVGRLKDQIGSPAALSVGRTVVGSVDEHGAVLRKQTGYRNDFGSILKVKFVRAEGGTRLACRYGMRLFATIFLIVWAGGLLFVGGLSLLSGLLTLAARGTGAGGNAWAAVVTPIVLGVFGTSLVGVGRSFARADEKYLMSFLSQVTHAGPPR